MKNQHMMIITVAAIAIAVSATLFAVGVELPDVSRPSGQTVSVTGTYTAEAEPTQATIVIGFENEADTAEEAQTKNSDEMEMVLARLRYEGLTDDNFETLNYNVWDQRSCWDCASPKITYRASHTLEITTDNLDKVGKYLDVAVAAGANNVQNVRFSVEEEQQNELKKEAIEKATKDARDKAEAMAAGLGLKVRTVVSISDSSWDYGPHRVAYAEIEKATAVAMADSGAHAQTQVIPGDVEVSARISATFELA
jgi:uncharacterized protein